MANSVSYLWKSPQAAQGFHTAVSLHSHTTFSKESLTFIPDHAGRVPALRWLLSQQEKRCKKVPANFALAYWTPPLAPRAAYELERDQIKQKLGLKSLVSITDHDNIEAPLMLRLLPETRHIPISVEWSVPYGSTEVHLGIHNLPSSSAKRWMAAMAAYTEQPKDENITDLIAGLHDIKDLLIVLNHPLWDLYAVGQEAHLVSLEKFLRKHNRFMHGFELSGMRGWDENHRVVDLANSWNQTLVSGGDRHGCEPNAALNLTNANTFDEFVYEIRHERRSNLLFMPQYQQSLSMRMLHTVNDVVRYMPDHPLGANWDDRTFHPGPQGDIRPLSQIWDKTPGFIQAVFAIFGIFDAEPVKTTTQFLWGGSKNAFRLPTLGEGREIA
ncbi:MAG TPA: hypothetical protein VG897_07195 [Terriglobales bacterium]|nr:hypothetical protein [Terriglobales bacterium]